MDDKTLNEIAERAARCPGSAYYPPRGAPQVALGYEERLINLLPDTPLYARRRNGVEATDAEIAAALRPVFEPAYRAQADRSLLLAETARLRALCREGAATIGEFEEGIRAGIRGQRIAGSVIALRCRLEAAGKGE